MAPDVMPPRLFFLTVHKSACTHQQLGCSRDDPGGAHRGGHYGARGAAGHQQLGLCHLTVQVGCFWGACYDLRAPKGPDALSARSTYKACIKYASHWCETRTKPPTIRTPRWTLSGPLPPPPPQSPLAVTGGSRCLSVLYLRVTLKISITAKTPTTPSSYPNFSPYIILHSKTMQRASLT